MADRRSGSLLIRRDKWVMGILTFATKRHKKTQKGSRGGEIATRSWTVDSGRPAFDSLNAQGFAPDTGCPPIYASLRR